MIRKRIVSVSPYQFFKRNDDFEEHEKQLEKQEGKKPVKDADEFVLGG